MSPYLEFEGKIIEKAVQKACETLNIPKEKLKFDVISYGSSGIFGLVGVKKAKIRVNSPEMPAASDKARQKIQPVSDPEPERETASFPDAVPDIGKLSVQSEQKDHEQSPESDRYMPAESFPPEPAFNKNGMYSGVQPEYPNPGSEQIPGSPSELGRTALQRIVDFITGDAVVSVRETPERIFFNIQGGNTAVLIGKRGQTLEAVQYIVEKVINKHNADRIRISIDVEGYLDSRRAKLEGLAARLAEKAKRIGKPVTIGQLNAHDRRIIHIALKDDTGVRTQSMGEGFYRKLVIFPQKRFYRKKEIESTLSHPVGEGNGENED